MHGRCNSAENRKFCRSGYEKRKGHTPQIHSCMLKKRCDHCVGPEGPDGPNGTHRLARMVEKRCREGSGDFSGIKKSGKRLTRSRQIDQKAEIEEGGRALSAEEHFLS